MTSSGRTAIAAGHGDGVTATSDAELIDRLRSGDESAFAWLIDAYSAPLMRLAQVFVSNLSVAEEVVQETWLAVLTGISRFEGRSSLKTWLFTILTNRAKTRARREKGTVSLSAFEIGERGDAPAVDPGRFRPATDPNWPGNWASPPQRWSAGPEGTALDRETMSVLRRGLEDLPRAQQVVVGLRDIHGWASAEVCAALGISEANQRVLLHRGRSRLRGVLERYFADQGPGGDLGGQRM